MILYKDSVTDFRNAVDQNRIADLIESSFHNKLGRNVPEREKRSWINSLSFMERIVRLSDIPGDCGVLIEYMLPNTSRRIDFIITGRDDQNRKKFIIVELKQWSSANKTNVEGVVKTALGGGIRETTHPSYQAASYKSFLEDFNTAIRERELESSACAYLHNYNKQNPEPLEDDIYSEIIVETPIFYKSDTEKLQKFIKEHVGQGQGMDILYEIENGKIKPSKSLIDHVSEMFEGNNEFTLLDDQKVAFEKAKDIALNTNQKSVIIIEGGPGTGKSVLSVNLLGSLLQEEQNINFVGPNAAFRNTIVNKLAKNRTKKRVKQLFKGSSSFLTVEEDLFDTIVVDEAHRLKDSRSNWYRGENQIDDIVSASKTSVFFIDERQLVRPEDIGSVDEIKKVAQKHNATVYKYELSAQFRCSGAEGYVNWLDDVLHIRETANYDGWDAEDFEFKIFSNPNKLRDAIYKKNKKGFEARMLAGYAWSWTKKGNPDAEVNDIKIPKYDFEMPWNSRKLGFNWPSKKEGAQQVGCIHTVQGLEFDYVGVLIGKDLKFDYDNLEYYTDWDNYKDSAGKRGLKEKPQELNQYVRNIYKVLLSRGMKGCYVYFEDKSVEKYFKEKM